MKSLFIHLALSGIVFTFTSCKKEEVNPINNGDNYASTELWKDNVMGAINNEAINSIAYNRPNGSGTYQIYISTYDGSGEVALTYPLWPSNRHQWAEEWGPTGQYLFCYVEKTDYVTESIHTRISDDAIPGTVATLIYG